MIETTFNFQVEIYLNVDYPKDVVVDPVDELFVGEMNR